MRQPLQDLSQSIVTILEDDPRWLTLDAIMEQLPPCRIRDMRKCLRWLTDHDIILRRVDLSNTRRWIYHVISK